jgi:fructuronate reductase
LLVRTVPTIRAERVPVGCATTVAAWILHLRGLGAPIKDAGAAAARDAANSGELPEVIAGVLDALEPGLGTDQNFVAAVLDQAKAIQTST